MSVILDGCSRYLDTYMSTLRYMPMFCNQRANPSFDIYVL